MRELTELTHKMDALYPLIECVDDPELIAVSKFLAERISSPESFVTFLGETSSGKSTIINGLLGKSLLPMKAFPTTGAITEIMLDDGLDTEQYYAVNKNATMEKLNKETALQLVERPDDKLARVRICTGFHKDGFENMRIFDTPGYDSIVEEHEEILKEFLPNSDLVIYTVNYKIGIQENDYAFLGLLKELLREDASVIVAVNRCPETVKENNPRIREIRRYLKDILQEEPAVFIIHSEKSEGNEYPLPTAEGLWNHVRKLVNSDERRNILYNTFDSFIKELYFQAKDRIQKRFKSMKLDSEELRQLDEKQKQSADRIRKAIELYVDPGFDKLSQILSNRISKAADAAENNIIAEINNAPNGKMEEMQQYTQSHLLPFYIKKESKELREFIKVYLDDINQKVDDYLNKEIIQFNTKVDMILTSNKEIAIKSAGRNIANRAGYQALLSYFGSFGGAGGANAGIANAASHMLKKIGDLFGKTFSRETHNALKHTLAKIGATSMKKVSAALTVIIELASVSIDYASWKKKLISKVRKAVGEWGKDCKPIILNDLASLKNENIRTINDIADRIEHSYETDLSKYDYSKEDMERLLEMCDTIANEIGVDINEGL